MTKGFGESKIWNSLGLEARCCWLYRNVVRRDGCLIADEFWLVEDGVTSDPTPPGATAPIRVTLGKPGL